MKKGAAIVVLIVTGILLTGCSNVSNNSCNNKNSYDMIEGKDYGQNLNPLDSLRKKFI